jgi:hypothetical protein
VSLISFIQDNILLPHKWKQYRRSRPAHQFVGLQNAKKIAIVTDFQEPSLIRIVGDFHKKIKKDGVSISLAAIVQDQRSNFNQFEFERQFPGSLVYLIASDEVNRWGQVKKILIQPFLDEQYDIIFFLDRTPSFTIYDIILSTSSRMVAGRTGDNREIVDFGIELDTSSPLENITNNLYKYLISIGEPKMASKTEPEVKKNRS